MEEKFKQQLENMKAHVRLLQKENQTFVLIGTQANLLFSLIEQMDRFVVYVEVLSDEKSWIDKEFLKKELAKFQAWQKEQVK